MGTRPFLLSRTKSFLNFPVSGITKMQMDKMLTKHLVSLVRRKFAWYREK